MTKGYEKEAYLYLLFHYTEKKRFSREHTKNPSARPDVTFWAVGYHPPPRPPESQLAFHIYYVKYANTLTCKRISWD